MTISDTAVVEEALLQLKAICPPEHYEDACLAARDRCSRGMGFAQAIESVYDDIARGTWPTGERQIVIEATPDDATTCPGCREAVPLGRFCKCPMRWKG